MQRSVLGQIKFIILFILVAVLVGCGGVTASNNSANVLMITDIHFDPYNSCGTSVNPDSEACVGNLIAESNPANWSFSASATNQFGAETNNEFFLTGLGNLKQTVKQYQINKIFVTGDLLSHKFPNQFESYVPAGTQAQQTTLAINTMNYVLYQISQAVPDAKIYFIFGNNDTDQSDYSYPTASFMQQVTPIVANYSPNPANVLATFDRGGYYVMPFNANSDVIALNFNPLTSENQGNQQDVDVAESQLVWLTQQLEVERKANKKVIILQHEPFGMNMFNIAEYDTPTSNLVTSLQEQYLAVYGQYKDIITNYYYGHYHMEDLQVGAGIFGVSSLGFSVDFYNNPGFKILQINASGQLQNYISYNSQYNLEQSLNWQQFYQLNAAYNTNSNDYVNYFQNVLQPESNNFGWETYVYNYSGNNTAATISQIPIISPTYWNIYYCALEYFAESEFNSCLNRY